jgi:hypothetical protein
VQGSLTLDVGYQIYTPTMKAGKERFNKSLELKVVDVIFVRDVFTTNSFDSATTQ